MGSVRGNSGTFFMERYRPQLSEKQISQQIVDYLRVIHVPVFRNNVGVSRFQNKDGSERYVSFGEKGLPDYSIIIFHKGLPLAGYVEVKKATGKQSDEQKHFQEWCQENNICYILARSVEDLQEGLETYKKRLT